jgi:hypothetical protein
VETPTQEVERMKKRFAMVIAGALVAVMLAGSAALSLGLLGARTAEAANDRTAPRVRTIERTVTVHRKSKAPAGAVMYLTAAPSSSSVSGSESEHESEEIEGSSDYFGESGEYEDD